ncbi:MAG: 3-hydroxyacyl-ACP dehydratase FabZ [Rickettsiales bacterium]|jgi:3-hydroxyacyl-[acyl-carrier-protein] dehydratase|nr:3-hydroxyacyl-ACP dehydratase FabZ [Rickettsiales bacterium]
MSKTLYIEDIKRILPHRYPFLLVDRVIDVEDGVRGTGIKNVTVNEEFFNGHFPTKPVMPGVLMLEAIAQTAVLVGSYGQEGRMVYLTGIDEARFKAQVVPGDQLHIKVEKTAARSTFEKWKAEIYVDGKLCVSASLSAMKS